MDPNDFDMYNSSKGFSKKDLERLGELDPMMPSTQKNIIKSIISGARATLNEPTRPETPADGPRKLFEGSDYNERPGSAYKIGDVADSAIDNFTRSSTSESNTRPAAVERRQSKGRLNPILEPIVRKPEIMGSKKQSVEKFEKKKLVLKKPGASEGRKLKPLKTFSKGKPIKIVQPSAPQEEEAKSGEQISLKDWEIGKANLKTQKDQALKQQEMMIKAMQQVKQDYDIQIEDPEEEDMETQFLQSMSEELHANVQSEQTDQYVEALSKLEEIKNSEANLQAEVVPPTGEDFGQLDDDLERQIMSDNQQLLEGDLSSQSNGFREKYDQLIQKFSTVIDNRTMLQLVEVSDITDRVWNLIDEWRDFGSEDTQGCYKETLIKGLLALVDNKNTRAVFRLCRCWIHVINSIFNEKLRLSEKERFEDIEFTKIFNSLKSVAQILYKYVKDDKNDELYEQEKIYDTLINVLVTYYIDGRSTLDQLTTKIIRKNGSKNIEIKNTDAIFDMLIYIVGLLKHSSNSKENQNVLHNKNAIHILSVLCKTVMSEEDSKNKKVPQLFVQITGWFRNLAMEDQQVELFIHEGALVAISQMLSSFKSHNELVMNIVRTLSKISLNYEALDVMKLLGEDFIVTLNEIMISNSERNSILVRSAFVQGNLTTVYSESRLQLLKDGRIFVKLLDLCFNLWKKDIKNMKEAAKENEEGKSTKNSKKGDFNKDPTEDSFTKVVRLIANLLTEPSCKKLIEINKKRVDRFFQSWISSLQKKTLEKSEECILNIVACLTNFLFYDTGDFSIFTEEKAVVLRTACIKSIGLFLFHSDNEELKVESMRVLCNLSRNKEWCKLLSEADTLLKNLVQCISSEIRDLVFYDIGLLLNIALDPAGRKKITKMCLEILIEKLRDSNIEDMDLSKVICKILVSFCEERFLWKNNNIEDAHEVCSEIGEELDSIMDVANDSEKEILLELRYWINQVINNIPEIAHNCPKPNCGRKFDNPEDLEGHIARCKK